MVSAKNDLVLSVHLFPLQKKIQNSGSVLVEPSLWSLLKLLLKKLKFIFIFTNKEVLFLWFVWMSFAKQKCSANISLEITIFKYKIPHWDVNCIECNCMSWHKRVLFLNLCRTACWLSDTVHVECMYTKYTKSSYNDLPKKSKCNQFIIYNTTTITHVKCARSANVTWFMIHGTIWELGLLTCASSIFRCQVKCPLSLSCYVLMGSVACWIFWE